MRAGEVRAVADPKPGVALRSIYAHPEGGVVVCYVQEKALEVTWFREGARQATVTALSQAPPYVKAIAVSPDSRIWLLAGDGQLFEVEGNGCHEADLGDMGVSDFFASREGHLQITGRRGS